MRMTKGFITLATGEERYFKLAVNLLKSYRFFSKNPLSFAILTDRHNKYTEQFDEVILLPNARSSYMDKLSIISNCPYDETIFIDADCLAYQDLNQYWDLHDFSDTLTCFGTSNFLDYKDGWFKKEDIGGYGNLIKFIPNMHGGCYFIKKGPQCEEIYKLAMEINNNYHKYKFKYFDQPADEPILALCMAIFDFRPIEDKTRKAIVFYPAVTDLKADMLLGYNSFEKEGIIIEKSFLIHWQNYFTKKAIYKTEVDKLNFLYKKRLKNFLTLNQPLKNIKLSRLALRIIKFKNTFYQCIDSWEFFKLLIKSKVKILLGS